jgi:hypothetical protein
MQLDNATKSNSGGLGNSSRGIINKSHWLQKFNTYKGTFMLELR